MPEHEGEHEREIESIADGPDPGIVREFIWFLRHEKKWWLTPIVLVLLALVLLALFTTSPVSPFIYTLF